jgi:hypothetical protein
MVNCVQRYIKLKGYLGFDILTSVKLSRLFFFFFLFFSINIFYSFHHLYYIFYIGLSLSHDT